MELHDPQIKERLAEADLVIGVNRSTGEETVIYGRPHLRRVAYEGTMKLNVVIVPLDYDTHEPEILAGWCIAVKGHCDPEVFEGGKEG